MKSWFITLVTMSGVISVLSLSYLSRTVWASNGEWGAYEYSETVEAMAAVSTDYTEEMTLIGVVAAPELIELRSEFSGVIRSVGFVSGMAVLKEQLIFQFDVAEEMARLNASEARAALAKSTLDRNKRLIKSNVSSQEKLDRARADYSVALADIEILKSVIRKKTIRAPANGVIGIHDIQVGKYVEANTPLVNFVGEANYNWVDFHLPQFYPELAIGTKVKVRLVSANKDNAYVTAAITAADSVFNKKLRTRHYRAKVFTDELHLIDGAAVELLVPISETQSVIELPSTSILGDLKGSYVNVLTTDSSAEGAFRTQRRSIVTAGTNKEKTLLISGVEAGELIATAGSFKLYEGILTYRGERQAKQKLRSEKL